MKRPGIGMTTILVKIVVRLSTLVANGNRRIMISNLAGISRESLLMRRSIAGYYSLLVDEKGSLCPVQMPAKTGFIMRS